MGGDVGRRVDGMLTDRVPWDRTRPMDAVQAAASKDKPLLERAFQGRDYAKVVDIALGWPLYFAKKFNATVPTWCACRRGGGPTLLTICCGYGSHRNCRWAQPSLAWARKAATSSTRSRCHGYARPSSAPPLPCPLAWPLP